ncbi:hypothetical protein PVAG01_07208 [Phlyctema vagabunda]|uniref:Transcriptional regulatory protein RXT2 N-terminal domain-containing protein n=1 Tax=Phlyctema vagabunda TaxID=108571 RepID=A0ABR4PBR6_9HELO
MASQAAIFADTIAGMKRAVKRKAYDSDSDSSIENLTNRGNKLRKKARYVHEGQLAPPSGPVVYRRRIEHAGFQRDIISRNPPVIDEDGYEVDSEDDDDRAQVAIANAAEFDPYTDVRIEHLLTPLTSASELPQHPTLAKPFVSKTLTELTRQAGEMVQKERASLWKIKHLLTRLSGDNTWIPCEVVETEKDFAFFGDEWEQRNERKFPKDVTHEDVVHNSIKGGLKDGLEHGKKSETIENGIVDKAVQQEHDTNEDTVMGNQSETIDRGENGDVLALEKAKPSTIIGEGGGSISYTSDTAMDTEAGTEATTDRMPDDGDSRIVESVNAEGPGDDKEDIPIPRRMRTRAQANAASDHTPTSRTRSMSPESDNEVLVHPFFLAPRTSYADRDFDLPPPEAEETRRLLQLYIQKQEEVCRGAQKVYDGLLKADRYRHLVMKWAKSEAHLRDMSDGEDWYDKEEWGLEEDLKKGQDEEEEDAATTAKKTRTRRQ